MAEEKMHARWAWLPLEKLDYELEPHPECSFWDATVAALDLSGTGLEGAVFAAMAGYLRFLAAGPLNLTRLQEPQRTLFALCAELAVHADFVEYGTSLRTAWITDRGKAWLADYEPEEDEHG